MTKKSTHDIISSYMGNEVPRQVKDNFEAWITSPSDFEEKNRILEDIWNSIPESDFPTAGAQQIIREAEAVSSPAFSARFNKALLWISSSAAVILLFICTMLFMSRTYTVTCLASSESSKSHFTLPDGTEVWLNKNSRLYYSDDMEGKSRTVKLEGEGFFDVAQKGGRPFIVEAHDMNITVLGTEFTVTAYSEKEVTAYLLEGSIKASGPGLKEGITLAPNQSVSFCKADGTYRKNTVNALNHTSWKEDRLVFHNASLKDIMESLSHWYQVNITCNDEAFTKCTNLTLTVRQESITDIFNTIQALVPTMTYSYTEGINLVISNK